MPNRRPTKTAVKMWLNMLVAKVPVTMGAKEIEAQITVMVPGLVSRHPAEVFDSVSLDAIVARHRFPSFPTQGEIEAALTEYRQLTDPKAKTEMPAEYASAPLDESGKGWLMTWHTAYDDGEARRRNVLALIRSQHQPAYRWLTQYDTAAAEIAVRHGWSDPAPLSMAQMTSEWDDPDGIRARVRTIMKPKPNGQPPDDAPKFLSMLRGMLEGYAPQHLHLVPEDVSHADYVHHGDILAPSLFLED